MRRRSDDSHAAHAQRSIAPLYSEESVRCLREQQTLVCVWLGCCSQLSLFVPYAYVLEPFAMISHLPSNAFLTRLKTVMLCNMAQHLARPSQYLKPESVEDSCESHCS